MRETRIGARAARLPWSAIGAVWIALIAFAVFYHDWLMPLAVAFFFAIPRIVRVRRALPLPAQVVLRTLLFIAAWLYSRYLSNDYRGVIVYAAWLQTLTRFCMIEAVLLHFGFAPYRASSRELPAAILMSALIFAAASKTVDVEALFIYFAVPYFICIAFSLRNVRNRPGTANLRWFAPRMWTHLAALLLVLLMGAAFTRYVGSHKRQLAPFFRISPFVQTTAAQQAPSVGFSDSPILGSTQNMTRSLERVLTIRGPVPDPHLRGLAFETYSAGRWLRANTPVPAQAARFDQATNDARTVVLRLSDYISVLFVPLHSSGVACERPELLECDAEHGCALYAFAAAPFQYQFRSSPLPGCQGPLCAAPNEEQLRRCLDVPREIDLRVGWLAKDITRGCHSDLERVRAITDWLRTKIKYSLHTRVGSGDPVSEFVLKRRAAHCEYFASAAALLLRCVNVPARYVTGFYAHEKEGNEKYVVRQQDAHAWAEAWIAGTGWITVDATPASGMPVELSEKPPLWRSASEWFADIYFAMLRWLRARSRAQWIEIGCGALAVGIAIAIGRRRRLRAIQKRAAFTYSAANQAAANLAERFDTYLLRRQIPCPPALTWQEHLAMLAEPDVAARSDNDLSRLSAFVRKYSALRFGGDSAAELAALSVELDALEHAASAPRGLRE